MGSEEQRIRDEEQVRRLLGELNRVEAPNDFYFGVKARIAKGKPAEKVATWLPVTVRYAVPLVLLVLVGGYFAFNAFYSLNVTSIPVVVADKPAKEVAEFGADTPMKRPAQPEEIAPAFVYFASEIDSSYVTGEVLTLLGGDTTAG